MIQAFFFDLQAINAGKLRPEGFETFRATKVAVLGAGMMGAGIAYSCARAGMDVLLKDVSLEAAERGKAYSEKLLDKAIARGRSTEEKKAELLGRITPTADAADLQGCDLVIEAVFEDPSLKHQVFAEVAPYVNHDALLCSNTSTLPITELATGVDRPADFIGLHFFSPVDKMPLVEIIKGKETSDAALAKAYDVVQQIRKTPIVVNDSRGFYTSRVIGTMVNEGLAMLAEGVHPMSLERAATQSGYPVGPLQLSDELNMELMLKIAKATADAAERDGIAYAEHPGADVVSRMVELGRPSRLKGAGFYEYGDNGARTRIWPGLAEEFPHSADADPVPGRQGPDALRRGARDGQVLRGGRDHLGGGRQHRLDHGHRLPAQHRRRRAVHDGLRVGLRRDRAGGVRRPRRRARRGVRRPVPADGVPAGPGSRRARASPPEVLKSGKIGAVSRVARMPLSALPRLVAALVVGAGVGVAVGATVSAPIGALTGGTTALALFVVSGWVVLWPLDAASTRAQRRARGVQASPRGARGRRRLARSGWWAWSCCSWSAVRAPARSPPRSRSVACSWPGRACT